MPKIFSEQISKLPQGIGDGNEPVQMDASHCPQCHGVENEVDKAMKDAHDVAGLKVRGVRLEQRRGRQQDEAQRQHAEQDAHVENQDIGWTAELDHEMASH